MPVVCLHPQSLFWESLCPGHTQVYLSPHTQGTVKGSVLPSSSETGKFNHLFAGEKNSQREELVPSASIRFVLTVSLWSGGTRSELQFLIVFTPMRTILPGT